MFLATLTQFGYPTLTLGAFVRPDPQFEAAIAIHGWYPCVMLVPLRQFDDFSVFLRGISSFGSSTRVRVNFRYFLISPVFGARTAKNKFILISENFFFFPIHGLFFIVLAPKAGV